MEDPLFSVSKKKKLFCDWLIIKKIFTFLNASPEFTDKVLACSYDDILIHEGTYNPNSFQGEEEQNLWELIMKNHNNERRLLIGSISSHFNFKKYTIMTCKKCKMKEVTAKENLVFLNLSQNLIEDTISMFSKIEKINCPKCKKLCATKKRIYSFPEICVFNHYPFLDIEKIKKTFHFKGKEYSLFGVSCLDYSLLFDSLKNKVYMLNKEGSERFEENNESRVTMSVFIENGRRKRFDPKMDDFVSAEELRERKRRRKKEKEEEEELTRKKEMEEKRKEIEKKIKEKSEMKLKREKEKIKEELEKQKKLEIAKIKKKLEENGKKKQKITEKQIREESEMILQKEKDTILKELEKEKILEIEKIKKQMEENEKKRKEEEELKKKKEVEEQKRKKMLEEIEREKIIEKERKEREIQESIDKEEVELQNKIKLEQEKLKVLELESSQELDIEKMFLKENIEEINNNEEMDFPEKLSPIKPIKKIEIKQKSKSLDELNSEDEYDTDEETDEEIDGETDDDDISLYEKLKQKKEEIELINKKLKNSFAICLRNFNGEKIKDEDGDYFLVPSHRCCPRCSKIIKFNSERGIKYQKCSNCSTDEEEFFFCFSCLSIGQFCTIDPYDVCDNEDIQEFDVPETPKRIIPPPFRERFNIFIENPSSILKSKIPERLIKKNEGKIIFKKCDPRKFYKLQFKLSSLSNVYKASALNSLETYAVRRIIINQGMNIEELKNELNLNFLIGSYIEAYLWKNEMWIIEEYFSLGSLSDILQTGITLEEEEISAITYYLLKSLREMHKQEIVHLDLRCSNLFLKKDGIKIVGFGKVQKLKNKVKKKDISNFHPYWLAPEIIKGEEINQSADIWSLGICLIELAEKSPPLSTIESLKALMLIPKVKPPILIEKEKWNQNFHEFLELCLSKFPSNRPIVSQLIEHSFVRNKNNKKIIKDLIKRIKKKYKFFGGRHRFIQIRNKILKKNPKFLVTKSGPDDIKTFFNRFKELENSLNSNSLNESSSDSSFLEDSFSESLSLSLEKSLESELQEEKSKSNTPNTPIGNSSNKKNRRRPPKKSRSPIKDRMSEIQKRNTSSSFINETRDRKKDIKRSFKNKKHLRIPNKKPKKKQITFNRSYYKVEEDDSSDSSSED